MATFFLGFVLGTVDSLVMLRLMHIADVRNAARKVGLYPLPSYWLAFATIGRIEEEYSRIMEAARRARVND